MSEVPTKLNNSACSDRMEVERYVSTDNHAQLKTIRLFKGNSLDQNSHICPADLEKHISEPMISSTAKLHILARPSMTQNDRDVDYDSLSPRNTAKPLTENPPEQDSNNRSPAVGKQISEPPKRSDKFEITGPPSRTQDEREEGYERNTLGRTVHSLKINPPDKNSKIRSAVFENQISEPPIFSTAKPNISAHKGLTQDDSDACYNSHAQRKTIRFLKENPPKHDSKIRPAVDGNLISEPPISSTAKMSAPTDRTKDKRDRSSDSNTHRRTLHPLKEIPPNTDSNNRSTTVGNQISEPTTSSTKFSTDPSKTQDKSWESSDINAQGKTAHSLKENVSDQDSNICSAAEGIRQSRPPEQDSKIHSGTVENNILEPPISEPTKRHFSERRDTGKEERNEGSPRHATQMTPSTFKENPPGQDLKTHSAAVEIGRSGPPDFKSNIQFETVGNITPEPPILVQANIDIPAITGRIQEGRNNRIQENPLYPNVKSRSASVENRPSEPTDQNSKISSEVVAENHIPKYPMPVTAKTHISTCQRKAQGYRSVGYHSSSQQKTFPTFKENPPDQNSRQRLEAVEIGRWGRLNQDSDIRSGNVGNRISDSPIPEPAEGYFSTDKDSKTRSAAVEIQRSELPDYDSIGRSGNLGNHMSDPPIPIPAERYVSARANRAQGVTNLYSYRHACSFKENPPIQNTSLRSEAVGNQISEIGTTNSPRAARRNGIYRFEQGRQEVSDPGHQQNTRRRNVTAQHYANGRFLIGNTIRRTLFPLQPRQNRVDAGQATRVLEPRQNLEAAGRAVRVLQPRPNMLAAVVDQDNHQLNQNPNGGPVGQIQGRAARVLEPRANRMDSVNTGSHGRMC